MMPNDETLMTILADLKWWFGFTLAELEGLTLSELETWLAQAQRQIKAGYASPLQ
ncbi:GpE family phage tail protein [Gallibacterium genomosp. 2]